MRLGERPHNIKISAEPDPLDREGGGTERGMETGTDELTNQRGGGDRRRTQEGLPSPLVKTAVAEAG